MSRVPEGYTVFGEVTHEVDAIYEAVDELNSKLEDTDTDLCFIRRYDGSNTRTFLVSEVSE